MIMPIIKSYDKFQKALLAGVTNYLKGYSLSGDDDGLIHAGEGEQRAEFLYGLLLLIPEISIPPKPVETTSSTEVVPLAVISKTTATSESVSPMKQLLLIAICHAIYQTRSSRLAGLIGNEMITGEHSQLITGETFDSLGTNVFYDMPNGSYQHAIHNFSNRSATEINSWLVKKSVMKELAKGILGELPEKEQKQVAKISQKITACFKSKNILKEAYALAQPLQVNSLFNTCVIALRSQSLFGQKFFFNLHSNFLTWCQEIPADVQPRAEAIPIMGSSQHASTAKEEKPDIREHQKNIIQSLVGKLECSSLKGAPYIFFMNHFKIYLHIEGNGLITFSKNGNKFSIGESQDFPDLNCPVYIKINANDNLIQTIVPKDIAPFIDPNRPLTVKQLSL
jgi:hypothetical protein